MFATIVTILNLAVEKAYAHLLFHMVYELTEDEVSRANEILKAIKAQEKVYCSFSAHRQNMAIHEAYNRWYRQLANRLQAEKRAKRDAYWKAKALALAEEQAKEQQLVEERIKEQQLAQCKADRKARRMKRKAKRQAKRSARTAALVSAKKHSLDGDRTHWEKTRCVQIRQARAIKPSL